MQILIVEDEEPIAKGLKFNFEMEGYRVEVACDGPKALEIFSREEGGIDLVILDLMLPGMSGYDICRKIREIDPHVPVMVLSARRQSSDKAHAFDSGIDQYVTKPFVLPELLSRVRNLLKRRAMMLANAGISANGISDEYRFANVRVDFSRFQVTVDETTHELTTMEMELLKYFIRNEGNVLSRSQILESVWGQNADVSTRTIDNFVLRLRKLLEPNPAEPRHILSVRGTGYRFIARPDESS